MTKIINKLTNEYYISKISTEKKRWLELMQKENPDFFERNELKYLFFLPMD